MFLLQCDLQCKYNAYNIKRKRTKTVICLNPLHAKCDVVAEVGKYRHVIATTVVLTLH